MIAHIIKVSSVVVYLLYCWYWSWMYRLLTAGYFRVINE